MIRSSEAKLIEALKQVERDGDVVAGRGDDPSSMILRHRAVRDDLIRWDADTGCYYLTSSGLARLHAGSGTGRTATIMRLPIGRKSARRVS
jgi:hypothetical protein